MGEVKLNCLALISPDFAIRADEVSRVDIGLQRTRITMTDGQQYSTSMSVAEVVAAVNNALNFSRQALSHTQAKGD